MFIPTLRGCLLAATALTSVSFAQTSAHAQDPAETTEIC